MGLLEKIKKMNKIKMYKAIALPLIFVLACASLFIGSQSFSKYIDEQNEKAQSSLTVPNIYYHRGRLTRTSVDGKFYTYPIKDDSNDLVFEDLRPSDDINYIFYVSNFNDEGIVNEIPAEVTIEIVVSLERLKAKEVKSGISYFVVGANNDPEMPNASFHIGKQANIGDPLLISYAIGNYIRMKKEALLQGDDGDYTGENFFKNNELYVDARSGKYIHRIGLQVPANAEKSNQAYLLRIGLPDQNDGFETYLTGRVHIDVNLIINQVLEIKK